MLESQSARLSQFDLRTTSACKEQGFIVKKIIWLSCVAFFLSACATPSVTRVQTLSKTADAPYKDLLVISLSENYDLRYFLEQEIVKQLKEKGIEAVRSTSIMDFNTPVNRETVLAAVAQEDSDAVLVTQLVDLDITPKLKDLSPEATYNFRPTYYYNVWSIELAEYSEPPGLELKHTLRMATQVFAVSTKEPVWAIESKSKLTRTADQQQHGTTIAAEAKAIVNALSRDGLLVK